MDERLFQATTLLALRPELSSSASSRLGLSRSRVSVAATPATVSQSISQSVKETIGKFKDRRLGKEENKIK